MRAVAHEDERGGKILEIGLSETPSVTAFDLLLVTDKGLITKTQTFWRLDIADAFRGLRTWPSASLSGLRFAIIKSMFPLR